MRVGVVILPEYRWWVAEPKWRAAEELGFSHAWTYDHLGWRTQAEQDASPSSGTMRMGEAPARPSVLDRPRAAMKFDAARLAEDLMVPLRRQWKS